VIAGEANSHSRKNDTPVLAFSNPPAAKLSDPSRRELVMARRILGALVLFGGITALLWGVTPRLISDFRHAGEFVPAQGMTITNYQCTNWNIGIIDDCTVTYRTVTGETRSMTDWRFGRAPRDKVTLMNRRDDATTVTTDLSLRTLWNRIALAFCVLLTGLFFVIALAIKAVELVGGPIPARATR
jgi:lysylphosphatidylglycerol synthetase-like protein (DUF2156 family)